MALPVEMPEGANITWPRALQAPQEEPKLGRIWHYWVCVTRERATAGLHASMRRYIDGDPRAFDELHAALTPRLRGFLLTRVRDEAACKDLLQLTLLKGHLGRHRFRSYGEDPDSAVQAWYFAIARNVAIDFLRDRHRQDMRRAPTGPDTSDDPWVDLPAPQPDPLALAERMEHEQAIIGEVRAAIEQLPPTQRQVVELHKLRGLSMADIASRLEIREGAVRVRAHRAYKALARALQTLKQPLLGAGGAHQGETQRP